MWNTGNPYAGSQIIYQAEPGLVQSLTQTKNRLYETCMSLINRRVHVQMLCGRHFEGTIVHVDAGHVFLQIDQVEVNRAYYAPYPPGYARTILPLVLFELLVIALL